MDRVVIESLSGHSGQNLKKNEPDKGTAFGKALGRAVEHWGRD